MPSMDRYAPKPAGVRDPRDPKKKNGMFWNPPRYHVFGGVPGATQDGTKGPNWKGTGEAVGPISDRGKGR